MNLISAIHSFDLVRIVPGTLVLCDIDNTLLYSTEDANSRGVYSQIYHHYFNAMHFDYEAATKIADHLYYTLYPMRPTDAAGFERMLFKIRNTEGCELIFLTARNPSTVDFTADNFTQIGLNPEDHMIHFSDTMPKGEYTKSQIDLRSYEKVVFIDDLRENIINMRMHIRRPPVDLYLFRMRN